jgi:flagellar biosynthetic protein FliQ
MDPQDAIDLGREAMKACFMIGGPILLASLIIGVIVGVVQAMTQVQDQTVSFVPKLLCLMLVIGLCLPWLSEKMVDFSRETLATPMTHFHYARPISQAGFARTANAANATNWPFGSSRPNSAASRNSARPASPDNSQPNDAVSPNPFSLPHFRSTKLPKSDIGG